MRRPSSGGLFLVVIDLGKFGVDDVLLTLALSAATGGIITVSALFLSGIHGLTKFHRNLGECLRLGLDRVGLVALQRLLEVGECVLDGRTIGLTHLAAVLGQRLLRRVHERISLVLGLDKF